MMSREHFDHIVAIRWSRSEGGVSSAVQRAFRFAPIDESPAIADTASTLKADRALSTPRSRKEILGGSA